MILQFIIDAYGRLTGKTSLNSNIGKVSNTNSDFENGELFNQVLNKCTQEHTHIAGLAGTGKSNLITILTNKLYTDKRTYIMCSNSISELSSHFQKHLVTDNLLIFCLKSDKTHTIDINYLFSINSFLDFICVSAEAKDAVVKNNYFTWFNFFDYEDNSSLLKANYFYQLKELIKTGHIDDYGDLNHETSKRAHSVYLTLQEQAHYFIISDDEKDKYIFFLNLLQLSLNQEETINIIFDESQVFFDGYRNSHVKSLNIDGVKNNLIFCSQLLENVLDDTQIVCFKGYLDADFRSEYLGDNIRHLQLDIKELKTGYFYFFDKKMNMFTNKPIKVPYIGEHKEIEWNLFLNNKQTKMHKQLQLDLQVNGAVKEKKLKV